MKPQTSRAIQRFEALTEPRIAQLGEIYAATARFADPFNQVQGLAAIQQVFRHMYRTLENPRFAILECIEDGDRCFLTWNFHFRFRSMRRGIDQTIPGATHLVFDGNGLITLHQDYWDTAQGLYEKLPLLGPFMRWVRKRAAS